MFMGTEDPPNFSNKGMLYHTGEDSGGRVSHMLSYIFIEVSFV